MTDGSKTSQITLLKTQYLPKNIARHPKNSLRLQKTVKPETNTTAVLNFSLKQTTV